MSRITHLLFNLLEQVENVCFEQSQLVKQENRRKKEEVKKSYDETGKAQLGKGRVADITSFFSLATGIGAALAPNKAFSDFFKILPGFGQNLSKGFESNFEKEVTVFNGKAAIGQRELELGQNKIEKTGETARKADEVAQAAMNGESRALGG